MKVTINDIAKAANVSKSTVSKVLNDAPSIPDSTKRKIREIMKELNYIPSSLATHLAKQRCFNIGLLIDLSRKNDFLNHFFYDIIGGVESTIGPLNYELTISNIHTMGQEHFMNRLVLNKKVDGLIMDNSILTKEIAAHLNELSFPFVSLGEMPGVENIHEVDIDSRLGGKMLTDHLFAQGYKRIAFIGGETNEPIFMNRMTGYTASLEEHGVAIDERLIKPSYANATIGSQLVLELLELEEAPDAVVCMNNAIAFGVLRALRERRIQVPKEMGVATFDNYPLAPYTTPALTAMHMDTFELGVAAGEMLMDRINDEQRSQRHRLIVPTLLERESTKRIL